MANRTTKVSLIAEVSGYVSGMDKAAKKTRELGSESEKLAQKKDAIQGLGVGLLAIGAVAAVGVGMAVKAFAEFDAKMSNVQAATNESASNMALLSDAALIAGRDTAFSASEAADAITELAKAGVGTADILGGGLTGALNLAAAGEISVARAAEIAATAMTQFKLEGSDVGRVADLLSSGANKAQGGVEELSQALSQGGLVAASTGLSIEETVGTLSAFASAGLLGSDAGTSFKSMLQRLTPTSKEAEEEMSRLGISAYDAQGAFIGMEAFAGNLQDGLRGMSAEQRNASQQIIFGADAVRAANVLYEQGSAGIGKWISEVDDSGAAARTAAIKMDNLNGDIEALKGSFETALIRAGSGGNESLRQLAQTATGLVNAFAAIPGPVLSVGLAVGSVVAVVGLVGGAAVVAVPKIAAFKIALDTLKTSGKAAGLGIGAATLGITALVVALGAIAGAYAEAAALGSEFQDSLDQTTGATTNYTRELVAKKLAEEGAFEAAKRAGVSQKELTDGIIEGGDKLDAINQKIRDSGTFFDAGKGNLLNTTRELRDGLDTAAEGLNNMQAAGEGASDGLVEGLSEIDYAAQATEINIGELRTAIEGFGSAQLDVNGATRNFEAAVDDLTASVDTNGASLDIGTEKGRTNQAALDAIASSALSLAGATLERTGSEDEAAAAVGRGRAELIKALGQFGITGEAAETYADKLGLIPDDVTTTAYQIGFDEAIRKANGVADAIRNIPGRRDVVINQVVQQTGAPRGQVGAAYDNGGRAAGGAIFGPGSGTSDTAGLYRLSNGEHVLTAAEVRAAGGQDAVYALRRELLSGTRGYATGGSVTRYMAAPAASGVSVAAAPISISVQSKGGIDLARYIEVVANGVVVSADASAGRSVRMGLQR